jgi:hypothetical protein
MIAMRADIEQISDTLARAGAAKRSGVSDGRI